MHVKAKVVIRGSKGSAELTALVDAGSSMTVVDRGLAEAIGVEYTDRERELLLQPLGRKSLVRLLLLRSLLLRMSL
ncbi:MAG: hypothetical protein LM583_07145 [Desulfurococcaceae archaeon]|nr:hypothetical protein [Desulfurococcaceae archaeon]